MCFRIYGGGGHLLEGIKAFYDVSIQMTRKLSDSFRIGMGVRQVCMISPYLFNDMEHSLAEVLFVDDIVLLVESKEILQMVVDPFDLVFN